MVESAQFTTYEHNNIIQLASYLGQPLTVGSLNKKNSTRNHASTEIMNLETGKWNPRSNYPFYTM